MAICAYVGRPGAGKSYGVVENVILPAFRKSRCVVTNIPMIEDQLKKEFDEYRLINFASEAFDTKEFWLDIPKGAIVVLDECWRAFPNGMKQDQIPQERREFLAEHRHMVGDDGYSTEIILVTQDLKQIAASVRPLIDKLYIAEKLDAVGADKRYRVDIYQGSEVKAVRFIRSVTGRYKAEVYKFYLSHTKSESAVAGIEERSDKRATIWGNKYLLIGVPLVWCGAIWASSHLSGIVDKYSNGDQGKVVTASAPVQVVPVPVQTGREIVREVIEAPAPPAEPKESKRWRIVGFHGVGLEGVVHLRSASGERRRVASRRCVYDLEWSCEVGGELVTKWSGTPSLSGMASAPGRAVDAVAVSASRDVSGSKAPGVAAR